MDHNTDKQFIFFNPVILCFQCVLEFLFYIAANWMSLSSGPLAGQNKTGELE